jgi:hypothetical protein
MKNFFYKIFFIYLAQFNDSLDILTFFLNI